MRPTQALSVGRYRHLKLTTKDVGKGFYKGNRTGAMGRHTKHGGYVIEWDRVRTYAVPENLKNFQVCANISNWREMNRNSFCTVGMLTRSEAHALREPTDQGPARRLQGARQGSHGSVLLRRTVETIQWHRLRCPDDGSLMYQSRRLDLVTSIFQRRTNFVDGSLMTTVLILYLPYLYNSNNLDAWSFVYPK
jgi:hypothetical protein